MRRHVVLSVALAGMTFGSCVDDAEPTANALGRARSAVIGGEPDAGDPAVVLLAAWSPDLATLDLCTATLIGPDVLLTAAHCVDEASHPGGSFGVFFGPDANAYPSASTLIPKLADIAEIHVHPDYDPEPPFSADIAVVILAEPRPTKPLPVLWSPLSSDLVGAPARIVGYGQTLYEEPNASKHEALTVLAAIDEGDTITVGDVDHKTCIGDSGGPALVFVDGVETVIGVNSYTDLAGCLEPAHYRRTDLYTGFLGQFVPAPEPGVGGAGGEGGVSPGNEGGGGSTATGDEEPKPEAAEDGCRVGSSGADEGDRRSLPLGLGVGLGLVLARRRARRTSR